MGVMALIRVLLMTRTSVAACPTITVAPLSKPVPVILSSVTLSSGPLFGETRITLKPSAGLGPVIDGASPHPRVLAIRIGSAKIAVVNLGANSDFNMGLKVAIAVAGVSGNSQELCRFCARHTRWGDRYNRRNTMPIPPGTSIGPYEIVGWLGAGGMGEVYRARDPRLGRNVAIKVIPESFAGNATRLIRFEQEARAAGQLNHPNILAVYDVGNHRGSPYIVSELLEGESLRSRLGGGALTPRRAIEYACQIADGLAAAHDKGIVHRDMKPDNLFVTNDGRVKILDFGIAKLTASEAEPAAGAATETAAGTMIGTAAYMSPEQVRGESVDTRSDIFSFGAVLHEMLEGRPAFVRDTSAEVVAAILKEDPRAPVSTSASPPLERIIARCLEKSREARFQSARDLAFALKSLSDDRKLRSPLPWRAAPGIAVLLVIVAAALAAWLTWDPDAPARDFAKAEFSLFTNWEGNEEGAEISPNGELVAFLSDRAGEYDVWVSQVGTEVYKNLTENVPPLAASGSIVRKLGFSFDSSQIWFNPGDGKPPAIMPWGGGDSRPFLRQGTNTPAWAPDGSKLAFVDKANRDDPIYLADPSGGDEQMIFPPGRFKNMNPAWSLDSQSIYFTRGSEPQDETEMDVWRLPRTGGEAERITTQHLAINFLAPIDPRTFLFVARAEDRSGPWLWQLDVRTGVSARVPAGVDQYTSVSASRDGRRIVATVANPSSELWRVPVLNRMAEERDAERYKLPGPTGVAFAPRFGPGSFFYLSARGTGDGLWKVQDGKASQIRRNVDGALSEPPAVSAAGRLAVVVRKEGQRRLWIMEADGTNPKTLAPTIGIEGAAGQGAADWSPDGRRVVAGGRDDQGPALFIIPVDGGTPKRLLEGEWVNPIWSPKDDLIVFAGRSLIGQVELRGIRPDGTPVALPRVLVRPGGYRFLPDGSGLVFLERIQTPDLWLLDLASGKPHKLAQLGNEGAIRTFDVTRDTNQTYIVFDRSRQNSNVVLIEFAK
jgi:Tol biopolymer transport system component